MDYSFSREEKLFVLAEILKSSAVDVEQLLQFISANNVVPNWMNMQLPLGRNMNQCIQVVDQMKAQYPLSKRPSTGSQGGLSPNGHRGSVAGDATSPCMQNLSSPSSLTSTSAIPPRSTSGADQGYGAGAVSLPQQEQPKKRGRPSRADKAKKDLRPMLPPRLAPRPQPVAAQRPLLPATSRSNGNSAQSLVHIAPNNLPAADEGMRDRKRMRLGGGLQDQQAGPSTANAASTVSSGAI